MKFQNSRLFLLLISQISVLPLVSSCYCHGHEKSALLHLFSTNSTSSLPSWTPHTDCCKWEGITCDSATGHVIAINVTHRNISSSINSSAFASFGSLLSLDLSWNHFSSPIPSNLSLLSNLTHLDLSNSIFLGQIPADIGSLKKLVALDISTNSLYSRLSSLKLENPSIESLLWNLSRLTQLHLDGVSVSSPLPKFLSNFTHLTSLRLSYCKLVGEFPANIFLLPKLETLDASGNLQLMGFLPHFPAESALRTLLLSDTGFSGSLPYSLGNLSNLSRVELSNCSFYGPIPSSVRKLLGIVRLEISFNGFGGPLPSLDGLTELQHLDLSNNHFSGQIPSLANLTRLAMLDLSFNNLTGEIPRWWSGDGLHNLTVLNLANNGLHGKIPSYLFTLPSLQTLRLNQNQLDGRLNEFGFASSVLETIDLSYNKLQGQVPRSILDHTSLKVLDLSSNRFNGSVDLVMFQKMGNLSWLGLSDNGLLVNTNFVDGACFPQLSKLYLGSCKLTRFPYFLRNQSRMAELDLSNNGIAGDIPCWVWNVGSGSLTYLNLSQNLLMSLEQPHNLSSSNLLILDLHSNQLQREIPCPPSSILVLDYSKNNFTWSISADFATALQGALFFSLSINNVSGVIPSTLCIASYLQVLDLSDNDLGGSIPNCVGDLNLNVLNLRNNHLIGIIPNVSSDKCSLRTLNLNGNKLEGKIPESLSYCADLEILDVGNNRLSGTFPYFLNTLSKLRVLVLRSNSFSGGLYRSFNFSFPVLQIIDLSHNSFGGTLVAHFVMSLNAMTSAEGGDASVTHQFIQYSFLSGLYYQDSVMVSSKGLEWKLLKILTIFKSVDLSNNKFEGEIPEEIGALAFICVLNISNNLLTGQIPVSIGKLRQLESLDLSENQLSGRIPPQLGQLTFLAVLNLSYNQLIGNIPIGPQLQTFSNDSFLGNPQLCGLPLSRNCSSESADAASPTSAIEGEQSSSSSVNWWIILLQVGYIVGLATFFGSLLLWRKWRIWYFKHVDMLLAYLREKYHLE